MYLCCHSHSQVPIENLKESSFSEIWKSKEFQEIRDKVKSGRLSEVEHCRTCLEQENLGMRSWRQIENQNWKRRGYDQSLSFDSPRSIAIRFSNTCNYSCRTCRPSTSTAWFSDAKLLNPQGTYQKIQSYNEGNPIPNQIEDLLPSLERIYFAGGEPLLERDHYRVLELALDVNPDIELSYDTNLSTFSFQDYNVFDFWKKFKNLRVSASVDGYGRKGEYIRKGFVWNEFLENWNMLKAEVPHARLAINFTLSIYNVLHVLEFVEKVKELKLFDENNPYDLNITYVDDLKWLSIKSLSKENKHKVREAYEDYMNSHQFGQVNQFLKDALSYMDSATDELESTFYSYTKRLDFIRNESFQEIFSSECGYLFPTL
ncbi:twitch domain-containing radical SAM protein [Bacteriovorax sp. DB6_IX]|uniref:twitch domain-containing radical SAM protein n=1 Tax=Bacteriovorax sp. DB6_IX TaxID=1353530 RepID=UPI0009DB6EEC|nr:twitch domain-containing radical SAM protein [Bacteriovorax sp. DB6_IX]